MKTIKLTLIIFLLGTCILPGMGNTPPYDCEADFDYTYVPTTPIYIQFTDISSGDPTSWHWDFGDGMTSNEQNPVHPYPNPGTYKVCLIIEHDNPPDYCIDSICKIIEIPDSVACEAIFTYELDPLFPAEVSFLDYSRGNITNWEWDFGDGSMSSEQDPVHVYSKPGEYLVCLNVYNADSMETCFHFICETIEIPDSMNCIAAFSYMADSSSQLVNQFSFYDESNGYPDNWEWDFGDGTISHEQNPVHVYQEGGQYEVCLNSWNSSFPGCIDATCMTIQTPEYYRLGGQAFLGSTPINNPYHTGDTGIAILYRQRTDKSLIAVDTNIFHEHGYYWFADMMEMHYVIKIGLTEGSAHYHDVVPSYYPTMMLWTDAASIMLDEDEFEAHTTLMQTSELSAGPGNITGRLMQGNRWDASSLKGYEKVPVILTDMGSIPLKCCRVNSNGSFSFSDIPYGTYKIYADLTGMYSLPQTVTLSEEIPYIDSIYIDMSAEPLLGISELLPGVINDLSLYPNPSRDIINLKFDADDNSIVNMMIYNQLGQQLLVESHMVYKGNNKLDTDISSLPEGIYFLRLQATNNSPLLKMFIKTD
jgi:PKD repeat protein